MFAPSISLNVSGDLKGATAPETAPYPRVFSPGPAITTQGDAIGALAGSPTPQTAEQARSAVLALKAAGVDAIKIVRDDFSRCRDAMAPLMRAEALSAIVAEAHRQQLKVYAHAPMLNEAKDVLRAGADGLLHGIIDRPVDSEFVALMRRNRGVYIPTLSLFEAVAGLEEWLRRLSAGDSRGVFPPAVYESLSSPAASRRLGLLSCHPSFTREHLRFSRSNLKSVFDAGIPVVCGTDTGFPGVLLGLSTHAELSLMVEAGLNPEAAIRSATIEAARMIGRERDLGTVESGKLADLLVLDADPLADIRNVRLIHRVVRGGTIHDRAQLLP